MVLMKFEYQCGGSNYCLILFKQILFGENKNTLPTKEDFLNESRCKENKLDPYFSIF